MAIITDPDKIPSGILQMMGRGRHEDPITELGRNWAYALASPAYLFLLHSLLIGFMNI